MSKPSIVKFDFSINRQLTALIPGFVLYWLINMFTGLQFFDKIETALFVFIFSFGFSIPLHLSYLWQDLNKKIIINYQHKTIVLSKANFRREFGFEEIDSMEISYNRSPFSLLWCLYKFVKISTKDGRYIIFTSFMADFKEDFFDNFRISERNIYYPFIFCNNQKIN